MALREHEVARANQKSKQQVTTTPCRQPAIPPVPHDCENCLDSCPIKQRLARRISTCPSYVIEMPLSLKSRRDALTSCSPLTGEQEAKLMKRACRAFRCRSTSFDDNLDELESRVRPYTRRPTRQQSEGINQVPLPQDPKFAFRPRFDRPRVGQGQVVLPTRQTSLASAYGDDVFACANVEEPSARFTRNFSDCTSIGPFGYRSYTPRNYYHYRDLLKKYSDTKSKVRANAVLWETAMER